MVDYSEKTREEYHLQHMKVASDRKAMKRLIGMFSKEYFGLGNDYFKNKTVLDAGCGDTASLIIALHRLGAREIHGLDLGLEFIPVAQKSLKNYGIQKREVTFTSGSVLDLPYSDEYFDFVAAHGLLGHLNNIRDVKHAFSELARVTKPHGYLYTVVVNVGGLFEDCIIPAARNYYRSNQEFRDLIDNLEEKTFSQTLRFIEKTMKKQTGEEIDLRILNGLFDTDLCATIQNKIKTPVRLKLDEDFIRTQYKKNKFNEIRRLKRYVKRENIRKFSAPLHYEMDNSISKILYGSGSLEFIGKKIKNEDI